MNSLERRVQALEARRGIVADGELSPLEAERRAIAAHGDGLAGLYSWLSQQPEGRPPGVVRLACPQNPEGAP